MEKFINALIFIAVIVLGIGMFKSILDIAATLAQ